MINAAGWRSLLTGVALGALLAWVPAAEARGGSWMMARPPAPSPSLSVGARATTTQAAHMAGPGVTVRAGVSGLAVGMGAPGEVQWHRPRADLVQRVESELLATRPDGALFATHGDLRIASAALEQGLPLSSVFELDARGHVRLRPAAAKVRPSTRSIFTRIPSSSGPAPSAPGLRLVDAGSQTITAHLALVGSVARESRPMAYEQVFREVRAAVARSRALATATVAPPRSSNLVLYDSPYRAHRFTTRGGFAVDPGSTTYILHTTVLADGTAMRLLYNPDPVAGFVGWEWYGSALTRQVPARTPSSRGA